MTPGVPSFSEIWLALSRPWKVGPPPMEPDWLLPISGSFSRSSESASDPTFSTCMLEFSSVKPR